MSGLKLKQSGSSGNISGVEEKTRPIKTTRSTTHGRSPSATGVKSKIPKNVIQNRSGMPLKTDQMASQTFPERPNSQGNLLGSRSVSRNGRLVPTKTKTSDLAMHRRSLESKLLAQKHNLTSLKKDIDEKQKNAMELIKKMSQLRDKLIAAGGKDPGKIDPIKLLIDKITTIGGDESLTMSLNKDLTITREFISSIKDKIDEETSDIYEICQIALTKNSEILKSLDEYCKENDEIKPDIIQKIFHDYEKDEENLNSRFIMSKKKQDDLKLNFVDKVEVLWTEIEASHLQIKKLSSAGGEIDELKRQVHDQVEKVKQMSEEKILLNEKLSKTESKIKEVEELNSDFLMAKSRLEVELKEEKLLAKNKIETYEGIIKSTEKIIQDLKTQLDEAKLTKNDLTIEKISEETKNDKLEIESLKEKLKTFEDTCTTKISIESKNLSTKFQEKLIAKDNELKQLRMELQKVDKTYEIAEQSRKIKLLETELEKLDQTVREQKKQLSRRDEMISILKEEDENQGNSKHMKIGEIMKKLEEKISQINKLEIIVKQFENQERSSQEQRTRLERRIAQLELEKNCQNNRNKKFSIM